MRFLAVFLLMCGPAYATCAPREVITDRLTDKFNESVKAWEVRDGSLWEFWGSDGGGTWTLLVTSGLKWSCIAKTGKDWTPPPGVMI